MFESEEKMGFSTVAKGNIHLYYWIILEDISRRTCFRNQIESSNDIFSLHLADQHEFIYEGFAFWFIEA